MTEVPRDSSAKREILYLTEYFPGSIGYRGGGAEVLLERLANTVGEKYQDHYLPIVFIASQWHPIPGKEYFFQSVVEEDLSRLLEKILLKNSPDNILHIGHTFLASRFPRQFQELVSSWQGGVVQRVPNISKLSDIQKTQNSDLPTIFSSVDMLISQSQSMTHELKALGFSSEHIAQIENGIDCDAKKPIDAVERARVRSGVFSELGDSSTVILYAGRMYDAGKKIEDLIRVWIEYKLYESDAHLFLAGEYQTANGDIQPHLASFFNHFSATERMQMHIHFLGLLPESEMERYYQIADMYVTPSMDEGFSNALLEALAFGMPAIGREGVHGNEHLIVPGETGLSFDSLEKLGAHLRYLIKNTEYRRSLGSQARELVCSRYSIDLMTQKYVAVYDSLKLSV